MLEVMHFIFSSFWIWLGTVILLVCFSSALANGLGVVGACFQRRCCDCRKEEEKRGKDD